MKSINQIFKDNKSLMDEPEVQKLIDYCLELEENVVDNNQVIDQTVVLKQLIFEIVNSCSDLIEEDKKNKRWPNDFPQVDFKDAIKNLEKYIRLYCEENYINL